MSVSWFLFSFLFFFFFSGFPVCGCCALSVLLPSLVDVLTGMNWDAAVGYSNLVTVWSMEVRRGWPV